MVFGKALLGGLLAVGLGKVRADAIGHSSRSTAANNTTVCPVLTYEDSSGQCAACPDGATCITAGQTIDTLSLEAGYWRGGPTLDIQECPRMDSCVGGADLNAYCEGGYMGPLCAVCEGNSYITGSYECRSCSRGGRAYTIIVIVVFCAALAAVLLLLYKGLARDVQAGDATQSVTQNDSFGGAHSASAVARAVAWLKQRSATLMVRFKILVTHFQIVAGLPALLRVNFPQSFTALTNTLNVFNLDFWGLLSSGCFFEVNFLNKLLFSTLLPLAIIAAIFGVHGARCVLARGRGGGGSGNASWRQGSWDASLQAALLTLFMFYVVASTTVLQTFDCDTVQLSSATGETASYLRADYSVDCDSAAYRRSRVYAIIMTAVYPIGVPVLYASLLLLSRRRLDPVRADAKRSMEVRDGDAGVRKTRFLWGSYRPRAFWYEVWLTLYKLLLSGLLVYFRQGTPTQTTVALLLTLVAMWLQTLVAPFTRRDENRLAECAYWATILTLIAALLISASETGSDGVNMALLGAILSIINLLVIVLAVVQLFWSASAWLYDLIGRDDADEKPNSNINPADDVKPADAATKQQRPAASGSGSSSTDAQDCLEQAMPAAESAPMSTSPRRRARHQRDASAAAAAAAASVAAGAQVHPARQQQPPPAAATAAQRATPPAAAPAAASMSGGDSGVAAALAGASAAAASSGAVVAQHSAPEAVAVAPAVAAAAAAAPPARPAPAAAEAVSAAPRAAEATPPAAVAGATAVAGQRAAAAATSAATAPAGTPAATAAAVPLAAPAVAAPAAMATAATLWTAARAAAPELQRQARAAAEPPDAASAAAAAAAGAAAAAAPARAPTVTRGTMTQSALVPVIMPAAAQVRGAHTRLLERYAPFVGVAYALPQSAADRLLASAAGTPTRAAAAAAAAAAARQPPAPASVEVDAAAQQQQQQQPARLVEAQAARSTRGVRDALRTAAAAASAVRALEAPQRRR